MRYRHRGGGKLLDELDTVQRWSEQPTVPILTLEVMTAAPARLEDGMIVRADGVLWNPGAGAGVYCYYGAAWNLLG